MWQITIGNLGHFLLDFLAQIWTQLTLRHILGPILVIFDICHFLTIPGPFEYFPKMGALSCQSKNGLVGSSAKTRNFLSRESQE